MRPALFPLLEEWLPIQRWYATKNLAPVVTEVQFRSRHRLPDGAEYLGAIVTDAAAGPGREVIYHVPLILDPDGVASVTPPSPLALVGPWGGGTLLDGVHDIRLARQVLPDFEVTASRVLVGEQSNTSVIVETATGPVIVKVFRVLNDGVNPDAEVGKALSEAGCRHVPTFVGEIVAEWNRAGTPERGHLAIATEFLTDGEDAWRLASDAVGKNEDFDAAGLGRATAEVHSSLAEVFGTEEVSAEIKAAIVADWRARAEAARAEVSELRKWAGAVEKIFDEAAAVEWPALQRIHGDLHLGQVLHSDSRGWILLDFEGEPLRPLADRARMDLTVRDVAGMLRSLDYAAGGESPEWVARHREAFTDGYVEASGGAPDPRENPALLRALEVDKALYEARYEARNRPDWLRIPLRALEQTFGA